MAIDPKRYQPGEGCIRHADGSITDAGFFDLDDEPPMSRAVVLDLRERSRGRGMSEVDLDHYLPLPDEAEVS